ncbi:hypothetical protein B0H10DRAFT_2436006 [Mycena sp. CBHHK59/15]|nr:hypothetical protein B0H10DRAFT_2436006 [Mycena sp. CBHHK59/15]
MGRKAVLFFSSSYYLPPPLLLPVPRHRRRATMSTDHSSADMEFIDRLPTRVLKDFRDYMFTKSYISANPHVFLDTAWINISALQSFLEARDRGDFERDTILIPSSSPEPPATLIKREFGASDVSSMDLTVKSEPTSVPLPFRTRSLTEGDREVIELLSDSDEDDEAPKKPAPETQHGAGDARSSSPELDQSDSDDFDGGALQKSDTVWLDPHVSSMVRIVNMSFTSDARTHVERMEYLTEIPSVWPIPRVSTAYVVDLSDPKFNLVDNTVNLIPVDGLVKRQDNDSWHGNSGSGNNTVDVTFGPVDPALLDVTRYELDVASRDATFAAQRETRRKEGETPEQRATAFFDRVKSTPCSAKHSDGTRCGGKPMLRTKAEGKSQGHRYWVACDGWTPSFKESHRTHTIPVNVDEELLVKLFANKPLANDDSVDTHPCSRIVHPHIGGKLKYCRHPHIINGQAVSQCPIRHRKCFSKHSFYIPVDPTIRKVLIFHPKSVPHNHPIPPLLKLSHESQSKYRKCVKAVGFVGSTVAKVDNGTSFMPGQFAPALQGKRVKRDIIREEKKKAYPAGLGVTGAYQLYREDLEKPLDERYIHRFQHTPDGGLIIFTCFTALLALLDDSGVKAFEDDTTFKRIEAVTLARAYINRSDTKFFELLFDMFHEIKIEATGKDIGFARFMPNGNLLVMNADMEAAQDLGAARSFMKTNNPSFSGIITLDPHLFATFFIKFCSTHANRPLPEFKALISADEYKQLKDFMYIDSTEALGSFSQFIGGLGVKKIQDWWAHKEMNDWVIPCLVKSQSNILPEHWDSTPATTNTGEAQHHWTNSLTGIKLTVVEGIESARRIDQDVVSEVRTSTISGVLLNSSNEMFHRLGRNSQRQSTAAKKSRESAKLGERAAELQAKINGEKTLLKGYQAELRSLKGTSSRSTSTKTQKNGNDSVIVSASSCGRVKTVTVPRWAKGIDVPEAPAAAATLPARANVTDVDISETPAAVATLPAHAEMIPPTDVLEPLAPLPPFVAPSAMFDFPPLPSSTIPALDVGSFGLMQFDNQFDFGLDTYLGDPTYDFNFDPSLFGFDPTTTFASEIPGGSEFPSNFDWSAFTPPQELPTLPPPPASSPLAYAEYMEPSADGSAQTRRPRQEVDEKNIIHSKRQRTLSTRAADAAAVERPTKKSKRSR